jgi:hypothetical protein
MNWGGIGVLIVFGVFVFLLIRNPNLACFGRKLKSPFYPLFRRKKMEEDARRLRQDRLKKIPTDDYGFKLDEAGGARPSTPPGPAPKKAED